MQELPRLIDDSSVNIDFWWNLCGSKCHANPGMARRHLSRAGSGDWSSLDLPRDGFVLESDLPAFPLT
ncbi:MAG: hypothetical protein CL933_16335 [Deltaproteobacteria bacterium]|nr:hypothetical protein [Deltaproteobacteria bacterium]